MNKSQELLNKYVVAKSRFLNLPDGEEVQAKFISVEEVPNHFDNGKTKCIRYHFEVNGKELLWDRTSRELAQQMSLIREGELILIQRIGEKSKTKYFIRKIE